MKCADFLAYLETGGVTRRLMARFHAVRCHRCAAIHTAWVEAKHQLATPEPLLPRLRQLWQQAAREEESVTR